MTGHSCIDRFAKICTRVCTCIHVLYLMEKINHLKINRARLRKTLRKTHLKINRKVCARSLRKVPWTALDELRTILGRPSGDPRTTLGRPSDDPGRPGTTLGRPSNDIRTKRSASQTIDLTMTINSVQESSKSELSSGTFGHSKVCARPPRKTSAQGCARLFTQDQGQLIRRGLWPQGV